MLQQIAHHEVWRRLDIGGWHTNSPFALLDKFASIRLNRKPDNVQMGVTLCEGFSGSLREPSVLLTFQLWVYVLNVPY